MLRIFHGCRVLLWQVSRGLSAPREPQELQGDAALGSCRLVQRKLWINGNSAVRTFSNSWRVSALPGTQSLSRSLGGELSGYNTRISSSALLRLAHNIAPVHLHVSRPAG